MLISVGRVSSTRLVHWASRAAEAPRARGRGPSSAAAARRLPADTLPRESQPPYDAPMPDRARDLMAAVEERLQALERITRDTDAGRWDAACKAEGWSVAIVAYHIARGFDRVASFIEGAASGKGPHLYNWDETHDLNARIADEHPLPTRDEVIATARAAIEKVRAVVSQMSESDLSGIAFINGPFQGTVEWLVRTLMPQHADGHLASIRSALAD